VQMRLPNGAEANADLDFLESGTQIWEIRVDTEEGQLVLADGGARLTIDGAPVPTDSGPGEYARLYRRFADLIQSKASDVDASPLQIVLAALGEGGERMVERFAF